jgi:hypothetical protein
VPKLLLLATEREKGGEREREEGMEGGRESSAAVTVAAFRSYPYPGASGGGRRYQSRGAARRGADRNSISS